MTQVQRNWWEIDESRPYGFISYAHHDRKKVDPIAYQLIRDGYPVWMDHDIVSGADWSEYIADHLKNASYAIIFLSEASIHSGNVRDEINFARNEGKPLIVVYLEDVSQVMPKGLHLSLDRFQAVNAYSRSFQQIMHELEEAVTFRRRRKQAAAGPRSDKGRRNVPVRKKKKNRNGIVIGVIAAAAVVLLAVILLMLRNTNFHKSDAAQVTATPEVTEQPESTPEPTTETDSGDDQNTNTQKNVQAPQQATTDYTFSSAVLSSRFNMSADQFRNFVAQQGVDVSGLNSDNGNVVVSLTDDQKNALIQAVENNASSAASQVSGDVTSAVYDNGYTGVTLTLSSTEVSSDDQSYADNLRAYGILIQSLNDSSSPFQVTFNDADGNLISTETY